MNGIDPEPPELLKQIEWFRVHGKKHKMKIFIAVLLVIVYLLYSNYTESDDSSNDKIIIQEGDTNNTIIPNVVVNTEGSKNTLPFVITNVDASLEKIYRPKLLFFEYYIYHWDYDIVVSNNYDRKIERCFAESRYRWEEDSQFYGGGLAKGYEIGLINGPPFEVEAKSQLSANFVDEHPRSKPDYLKVRVKCIGAISQWYQVDLENNFELIGFEERK